MNSNKVAMLFPGQGAWYPGVLQQAAAACTPVARVLATVDTVSRRRLGHTIADRLWQAPAPTTESLLADSPDTVQLAIFAASVGLYRWFESEGLRPDILMGHSFGEIAALVCAGAFTVEQGAEIVCDRTEVSRLAAGGGSMAALGTTAAKATALLAVIDDPGTVVAGENSAAQTVISGTPAGMDRAASAARALSIPFFKLNSPYPFHSPSMEPVRAAFAERLRRYGAEAPTLPVLSPILGRCYAPGDRLTTCLADHLVQRVSFMDAVQHLQHSGVGILVECGALDALTKLARAAAPAAAFTAVSCLSGDRAERESMARALDALAALGKVRPRAASAAIALPGHLTPAALDAGDAEAFWHACGEPLKRFLDQQYIAFAAGRRVVAEPRSAAVAVEVLPTRAAAVTEAPRRSEVFRHLVTVYAAALEYPEDVFTEAVDLEGELGIDSVKQTELLARVSDTYRLPPRPADFRLSAFNTLGKVADLIVASLADAPVGAPRQPAPFDITVVIDTPPPVGREELLASIVSMYADALEYPEDVFTPDVALEAELGIDSVKQTELLARLSEIHALPPRPADFRLSNYDTLGKVADFVFEALHTGPQTGSIPGVPSSLAPITLPVRRSLGEGGAAARSFDATVALH